MHVSVNKPCVFLPEYTLIRCKSALNTVCLWRKITKTTLCIQLHDCVAYRVRLEKKPTKSTQKIRNYRSLLSLCSINEILISRPGETAIIECSTSNFPTNNQRAWAYFLIPCIVAPYHRLRYGPKYTVHVSACTYVSSRYDDWNMTTLN